MLFENCKVLHSPDIAVTLGTNLKKVVLRNNYIYDSVAAIILEMLTSHEAELTEDVLIESNVIETTTEFDGAITIGYSADCYVKDVKIINNIISDTNRGIRVIRYSGTYTNRISNVLVMGNTIKDLQSGGVAFATNNTLNLTVEHNIGFVTENSGTATITGSTSVTFNHGLAGTPTHVAIGFKTAGYGSWRWSATSTQITITVANSGTYNLTWYAEYRP